MKKSKLSLILYVVFLPLCCGCAHILTTPETDFFTHCIQNAAEYEKQGDLVAAKKQIALALTIDPQNQAVLQKRTEIQAALDRRAAEQFQEGLQFNKYGKYNQAQIAFLAALRMKPDYPEAVAMLTDRKRLAVERYVLHTISPGESLVKIAKQYYGDSHKFAIIARYNDLPDATIIRTGQVLKVPWLQDEKFLAGEDVLVTESDMDSESGKEEEIDQIAIYRDHGIDLFKQKKFSEALVEFDKVLSARPDDQQTRAYLFDANFQIAVLQFERKEYLLAIQGFQSCLAIQKDCRQCRHYLQQCEEEYKEAHYKKGMQFFDKEQLTEAIREWELIRERDPHYKRVEYLINKAGKIQARLEELKGEKQ